MNVPHKIGEQYTCFVVEREDLGWGGPYGQTRRPTRWRCEECGYLIRGDLDGWRRKQMADHHECGHAPCERCGQPLLRRKDGTPRQHSYRRCPGKNEGFKIDREFARNIARREYV